MTREAETAAEVRKMIYALADKLETYTGRSGTAPQPPEEYAQLIKAWETIKQKIPWL